MTYFPYSIFGVIVLLLDIVAIVSLLSGRSSLEHKALWTVVVLILPFLGMVLYFGIGRNKQDAVTV